MPATLILDVASAAQNFGQVLPANEFSLVTRTDLVSLIDAGASDYWTGLSSSVSGIVCRKTSAVYARSVGYSTNPTVEAGSAGGGIGRDTFLTNGNNAPVTAPVDGPLWPTGSFCVWAVCKIAAGDSAPIAGTNDAGGGISVQFASNNTFRYHRTYSTSPIISAAAVNDGNWGLLVFSHDTVAQTIRARWNNSDVLTQSSVTAPSPSDRRIRWFGVRSSGSDTADSITNGRVAMAGIHSAAHHTDATLHSAIKAAVNTLFPSLGIT